MYDAISKGEFDLVGPLVTRYMLLTLVGSVFAAIQAIILVQLNSRFGQDLRLDLFSEIMRKDVEFFDSRKTGDLISRLNTDVQQI